MIGMPPLPVRKNNHPRPRLPNYSRNFQPILPGVLDAPVRDVESPPPTHAKNLGRVVGFSGAVFSPAPRTHFALSQVENSGSLAALGRF